MQQEFKIAGNRIGVLIGKRGETKRAIEEQTASVLTIDSEEGLVTVEGEDPVQVLLAGSVVQAIGRGFSPENAFALLEDEDLIFEQIDLGGLDRQPAPARPDPGTGHRPGREGARADRAHDRHAPLGPGQDRGHHRPARPGQGRPDRDRDAAPRRPARVRLHLPRPEAEGGQGRHAQLLLLIHPRDDLWEAVPLETNTLFFDSDRPNRRRPSRVPLAAKGSA